MAKTARGFEIMEDYGGVGNLPSVPTGPVIDQDGVSAMLPSQDVSPSRGSLEMASRPATLQEAETIRRLLGVSVVDDRRKLSAVVASIDSVREQTGRMVDGGVHIGRVLNDVRAVLSSEEFARLLRSGRELLSGWTSGNLSKMMGAARFVDSNRVSRDILPQSYTVLYALSLLDELQIQRAIERRIVRPSLTRSEVEQMRRIGKSEDGLQKTSEQLPEVRKLDERIELLSKELRAVRAKRTDLLRRIGREAGQKGT